MQSLVVAKGKQEEEEAGDSVDVVADIPYHDAS